MVLFSNRKEGTVMSFRNWMQTISLVVIAVLLARGFCNRDTTPPVIYSGDTADSLDTHGYDPATVKPPQLPPFLKPEQVPGAKPIVYGGGTWIPDTTISPGDTLDVQVSAVFDPSGKPWLGVWINGKPVPWFEPPEILIPEATESKVSVIFEAALVGDEIEPAAGLSWTPLVIAGAETGIGATISLHGPGHWGAAFVRSCGRIGPLDGGLDLGYRVGRDHGFHFGASIGLRIDF